MVNIPDIDPMVKYIRILKKPWIEDAMSAWWVLFTLLIWSRVKFVRTKKGGANLRHPSKSIFQPSDIFLSFFFFGGDRSSKISNKQWRGFEDFEFCSDVFFQNKESSSYSNIPKGSMFGTIRIFETLEWTTHRFHHPSTFFFYTNRALKHLVQINTFSLWRGSLRISFYPPKHFRLLICHWTVHTIPGKIVARSPQNVANSRRILPNSSKSSNLLRWMVSGWI